VVAEYEQLALVRAEANPQHGVDGPARAELDLVTVVELDRAAESAAGQGGDLETRIDGPLGRCW